MPRSDVRRWIYGGLDLLAAAIYILALLTVIPNRHLSATIHLWTLPVGALVLAAGTLRGTRRGWQVALAGGTLLIAAVILLLLRLVVSAAFLAGVYGSFGTGAAAMTLVAAALVIELVALLPIVQVKFLLSRAGRRAFGVAP